CRNRLHACYRECGLHFFQWRVAPRTVPAAESCQSEWHVARWDHRAFHLIWVLGRHGSPLRFAEVPERQFAFPWLVNSAEIARSEAGMNGTADPERTHKHRSAIAQEERHSSHFSV